MSKILTKKPKRVRHETMTEAMAVEAVRKYAKRINRMVSTNDRFLFDSPGRREGQDAYKIGDVVVAMLFPTEAEIKVTEKEPFGSMEAMKVRMDEMEIIDDFFDAMRILGGHMLPAKEKQLAKKQAAVKSIVTWI